MCEYIYTYIYTYTYMYIPSSLTLCFLLSTSIFMSRSCWPPPPSDTPPSLASPTSIIDKTSS